ncbi:hypothetical protein Plhal304r1_c027g0090311 [Plasmopara halstedii]
MVNLVCAIVGAASNAFEVNIDDTASVAALKKAVKAEKPNDMKGIDADKLELFLAKTEGGVWLDEAGVASVALDERGNPRGYEKMRSTLWIRNAMLFGDNFQPGEEQIHVLVVVPAGIPFDIGVTPSNLLRYKPGYRRWIVHDQFITILIGEKNRSYGWNDGFMASSLDQSRMLSEQKEFAADCTAWLEHILDTMILHVALVTRMSRRQDLVHPYSVQDSVTIAEENALRFDNALQEEPVTLGSPLDGQAVTTSVAQVECVPTELQRVYFIHYDPHDTESLQDTMSILSLTTSVSNLDASTDEFQYQRIEHERYFLPYGKAESCHLVSKKHCTDRDFKREFAKYDRDANNRLALSRDMHGFYDGLSMDIPIVNIFPGCVDSAQSVDNRYKIDIFVKVFDARCKDRVFSRLKEGTVEIDDPLMMKTFVYVENPETFCFF